MKLELTFLLGRSWGFDSSLTIGPFIQAGMPTIYCIGRTQVKLYTIQLAISTATDKLHSVGATHVYKNQYQLLTVL